MSFWTNHKLTVFLACSLLLLSCVSLFVGVLPLGELAKSLLSPAGASSFSNTFSISALELIAISRLPRLLAILMAGMGLAVAGLMICSSRKIFFYHIELPKDFPYLSALYGVIHVLW